MASSLARLLSALRPAELTLLAFAGYCALRLALAVGPVGAGHNWVNFPRMELLLSIALVLAVMVTRLARARRFPASVGGLARWGLGELREWAPVLALVCFYPWIPLILKAAAAPDRDAWLAAADRALFFGHDPLLLLERAIWAPLSEWLAFSYTLYAFIFLAVTATLYSRPDPAPFRWLVLSITLALALGYFGYTVMPAQGPLFTASFSVSLELHYMKELKELLMDRSRVPRDCFPSLHTGVSLLLLFACWKQARVLFWVFLPVVASIPVACVYLRYHYVVDVLAGALLAGGIAWLIPSPGRVSLQNSKGYPEKIIS